MTSSHDILVSPTPAESLSSVSLRRIWLVARRDYFGYIKTWGFWLSFLMPVVFGMLGFVFASGTLDLSPPRYETILDDTGEGVGEAILADYYADQAAIQEAMAEALPESLRPDMQDAVDAQAERGSSDRIFIDPPADTIDGLQPYLRGEKRVEYEGRRVRLSGALHIFEDDGFAQARYWSENVNAGDVAGMARRYFRKRARADYLAEGGLTLEGLDAAVDARKTSVETFDPTKAATGETDSQAVTQTDRVPFMVAVAAAMFLWFTVFSGAYMLLTSMLEEKLGKLMEMTLATTQFAEIMMGKLLGIAMLTLTAMAPYILLAVGAVVSLLAFGPPEIAEGLRQAFTAKMIVFFPLFLVLGYIFYGSVFIALGSLSESMQDAQTITIPVMIVLTACVLVVPQGLSNPDSPIVHFASWFPLSAPFAAIIRVPSDPSWLTLISITALMLFSTVVVTLLATRVFRHGMLSGSGLKGLGDWLRRTVLRQRAT